MDNGLIVINDYCKSTVAEPQFIRLLKVEGLITIIEEDGTEYLLETEIQLLDRFTRLHYDLAIDVENLEVVQNLVTRIENLQNEVNALRRQLKFLNPINDDF